MANLPADVIEIIRKANAKNYVEQAKFFLNAAFHNLSDADKEEVFQLTLQFAKEDPKKANGNELNMTQAFHLLQSKDQTMTALALKNKLRETDIDANGEMALLEYAIFAFKQDPIKIARAPQGSASPEEQAKLEAAEEQLRQLSKTFDELAAAQQRAKDAEEAVRALTAEAKVVAAEIKREEDAKAAEIARLEALSTDQTVGIVKRNMAVQQLAAAKNEDPLPLRKAKLTQDAIVRKLTKATEVAATETAAATAKADEAAAALKQAEADFDELKRTCSGVPQGAIFMAEREIAEKKKYLPQRLQ